MDEGANNCRTIVKELPLGFEGSSAISVGDHVVSDMDAIEMLRHHRPRGRRGRGPLRRPRARRHELPRAHSLRT
ncbi:hypothetical protein GCM10027268_16520 [Brachybacterium huguangmaarense]